MFVPATIETEDSVAEFHWKRYALCLTCNFPYTCFKSKTTRLSKWTISL